MNTQTLGRPPILSWSLISSRTPSPMMPKGPLRARAATASPGPTEEEAAAGIVKRLVFRRRLRPSRRRGGSLLSLPAISPNIAQTKTITFWTSSRVVVDVAANELPSPTIWRKELTRPCRNGFDGLQRGNSCCASGCSRCDALTGCDGDNILGEACCSDKVRMPKMDNYQRSTETTRGTVSHLFSRRKKDWTKNATSKPRDTSFCP